MGILDFLTGNSGAASPWGALYQNDDAKRQAAAADLLASMGVSPTNLPGAFGDPSKLSAVPAPAPAPAFGAGASPFGFAGPGSMTGINPAMMAPPAPIGPPAPPQAAQPAPAPVASPAPPSTDLSSVNRAPGAPVPAADDGEEDTPAAAPVRPPVAPIVTGQPSPVAPFSLGGGAGLGDRLAAAAQSMGGSKGLIPALFNGGSALLTGQRSDAAGKAQSATAQALIAKGATPAEVGAAIGNPTLMSALIQQYYGKDKWGVVQVGEDGDGHKTYMQQNQMDGTLRPIAGGPSAAPTSNTVTGPDGRPIAIPPGANRKEFIKRVTEATADAATGKKTEAQAKASSFAARMTQAEGVLGGLQNEGLSLGNTVAGKIPVAGNYLQSTDYQRYKQASSAFITAMLRQESGAAINKSEFDRYEKEMFPQPGDDPTVVQQKAAMRAAAIEQMKGAAGPGFKGPAPGGTVNVGGQAINWSVK